MEDPPILGLANLGLSQFFITNDSRFNKSNLYKNCVPVRPGCFLVMHKILLWYQYVAQQEKYESRYAYRWT